MTKTHPSFVLLLALICVSCVDGGSQRGIWTGTVRDSAGIRIVENPEFGLWTPETAWRLEEDLRIGVVEGDANLQFGEITGIDVFSDGRIVVRDRLAEHQLRVFSNEGGFLYEFGSTGSGPGELGRGLAVPQVGFGDTLFVPDIGRQRICVYTADGTHVASVRTAIPASEGTPLWDVTSQGTLVAQLSTKPMPNNQEETLTDFLVGFDLDGGIDSLFSFPSAAILKTLPSGLPRVTLFSPEPAWAFGDDGILWYGPGEPYRVHVYENGELASIVSKTGATTEITQADRDVVIGAWEQIFGDAFRDMATFAEVLPAYQRFLRGPENTLWVQLIEPPGNLTEEEVEDFDPEGGYGGDTWDVFDSEGRFLGSVIMPPSFEPFRFSGGALYGIWQDEMEVDFVKRLRLVN